MSITTPNRTWKEWIAAIGVTVLLLTPVRCLAQDYGQLPPPNTLISKTVWSGQNNQFVTSTVEDVTGWWWGTDNDGLWHYAPDQKPGKQWMHYRAEDGLYDDSITALCLDKKGRLWVGTERRGVSVFNNSWWHNYDIMSGPLGVHVTSITLNPTTGDIWVTSEGGLAIYSDATKKWRYITKANGLATDQLNCAAFLASGEAVIGTADDGLLISSKASNYTVWTHISASPAGTASETGSGLSSNQINCLLVNKAGKIFCGTSCGLSFSTDSGKTWSFLHGWMWQVKIKRVVRDTVPVNEAGTVLPLSDDYISALAFDENGFLYVGHIHGGVEVIDDTDGSQQYHTKLNVYGTIIRSLTLLHRGGLLVGNYGSGASVLTWTNAKCLPESVLIQAHAIVDFPVPAQPLGIPELKKLASTLVNAATPKKQQSPKLVLLSPPPQAAQPAAASLSGYFLGEDWQTQGNWIGRYGSEFAILCGADDANKDFILGDQQKFSVSGQIGIALNGNPVPSHWLQWQESGDPRVLYDPEVHVRRESEWDDQGDQDERLVEGPDIWLTVTVPSGNHRVSLYFMNKDGHTRATRLRDFIVQLMPSLPNIDFRQTYDSPDILPPYAETRVENFWPGVYERFEVTGPGTYYFKIDKNYSLNTIVQGVFIDSLDPAPSTPAPAWMNGFDLASKGPAKAIRLTPAADQAAAVWYQLDAVYGSALTAAYQRSTRIQLLRVAAANKAPNPLLTAWRLQLGLWDDQDWSKFNHELSRLSATTNIRPKS